MSDLLELLDRVVARAATGEGLEAFGVDQTETTVKAYQGEVESLSSSRTRGVGIRVVRDGRVGYAYTADLSDAALGETLATARDNARVGTPDEANVLVDAGEPFDELPGLYDPSLEQVAPEAKVDAALRLEAATVRGGAPIKGVDSAQYGDGVGTAAIASTTGVRGAYRRTETYVLVEALAEADGATTSAYGIDMGRTLEHLDIEAAAQEARTRATRLLGGAKPPSARLPVLLDPFVTASFLGVLAGGLTAEAVQRGRSLFADKVGQRLAQTDVTLLDDGRHPDGPASAPWDGEGTPTRKTVLLDGGVLEGFLHNAYTAAKDGVSSTGNAKRAGYRSPPGISPSNLYLVPGEDAPDALLARAGTAFYCQQVMGLHSGANPISGDFSVGAAGVMVRDGQMAEPVREATIAGTIPEILAGIAGVGEDLRFLPFGGGMGGATLLIEGMTLAGA